MTGKTKLQKKYAEFKASNEDYIKLRKKLLKEPEEKSHEIAEDLGIYTLRKEVEVLLAKRIKQAWNLYRKIWSGKPSKKDVDKFLDLADEIQAYTDLIPEDMLQVWKVSRDLIWAYGQVFYKSGEDGPSS